MSAALATPMSSQVLMTVELCPQCQTLTFPRREAATFRLVEVAAPFTAIEQETEATWEDAEWQ